MTEYLTLNNMTAFFTALLVLEMVLRYIAPLTKTDLDDKALAAIKDAKAWAVSAAPSFYAIVEQLAASGRIPAAEKAQEFSKLLADAYQKANGKPLPGQAHIEGEIVAKGLAAADKLAGNPQKALSK